MLCFSSPPPLCLSIQVSTRVKKTRRLRGSKKYQTHRVFERKARFEQAETTATRGRTHLLALIGDSLDGLATGVDDDMSAVILCVPSPQLVEVAAISSDENTWFYRPLTALLVERVDVLAESNRPRVWLLRPP